ncbi:hypothetical protein PMAYCL1PPCAC_28062, partial [Pristionchus mayeri]
EWISLCTIIDPYAISLPHTLHSTRFRQIASEASSSHVPELFFLVSFFSVCGFLALLARAPESPSFLTEDLTSFDSSIFTSS